MSRRASRTPPGRRRPWRILVALLVVVVAPLRAADEPAPRSLVFMIADGFGPASMTLTRRFADAPLQLDRITSGSVSTHTHGGGITDSAASATALASGVKTLNGAIGMDAAGRPVATLLEAAEARGMATGLVTTTRITHATPACFVAHVPDRGDEQTIAIQEIISGVDLMIGGGAGFFLPAEQGGSRVDGRDLFDAASRLGYTVARDRAAFDALEGTPALAILTPSHMSYEIDRDDAIEPSLAEMVAKALALLGDAPEGFLLVVEGGRIDHAGHANDPAAHVHDALAYDAAVGVVLAFAEERGDVLVVSTADHETGGLTIGRNIDGRHSYEYDLRVLERARASLDAIARRIVEPDGDIGPFVELSGVADPTDAERARIDAAMRDPMSPARAVAVELSAIVSRHAGLGWTTWGHTGVDVGLFAAGPGADRLAGHLDNTEVALLIAELMGFDLDALTADLGKG